MDKLSIGHKLMIVPAFLELLKTGWKWPGASMAYIALFDHVVVKEIRELGPIVEMPDGTYVGGISFDMADRMRGK